MCTIQDVSGDIGPTAAYSLQAILDNSFESIFGVASAYGADDASMRFRHLFSKGAGVVDHALTKIKDENACHQSALDGLTPISIAATIERLALPIQLNVASLHAAGVVLASIMEDMMDRLTKTILSLQTLAHHSDIIVEATEHCLDEAVTSIKRLIEHGVANAAALEKRHGQLVALELRVEKVTEDGTSTVGLLRNDVDDVNGVSIFKKLWTSTKYPPQ